MADPGGVARRTAAVAVALAASGCAASEQPTVGAEVRDSMGVRIVEYAAPPARPIDLAPEPRFRHGRGPDDYLFERVWTGALLEDGAAVVIDIGAGEVVFFGAGGQLEHVAASGQGPGEVTRPIGVHALGGDTVLVEDDGNARFSVFVGGDVVRSISTAGDYSVTQALRVHGLTSDGRFIMSTSAYRTDFEEPWFRGTIALFDPSDATPDTVAKYDMAPRRPPEGSYDPFGAYGEMIASGGRPITGRTDRAELRWLDLAGNVVQIVRWEPDQAFPTQADWDLFESRLRTDLARVNPQAAGEALQQMIQRQVDNYDWDPDSPFPAFGRLISDGAGGVWIGEYTIRGGPDGPRSFSVVSADAEWGGTVRLPDRFRVLAVRGELVLGVLRDELDVESIAVFEMLPNG